MNKRAKDLSEEQKTKYQKNKDVLLFYGCITIKKSLLPLFLPLLRSIRDQYCSVKYFFG